MKPLFCAIAMLLTGLILPAQNTDFAPVGAKWYYSELNFALKVVPHIIESVSKENYQGKWCSKLVSSSNDIMANPAYIYTENDTVYYFNPASNKFELLYDFRAKVGDSWVMEGLSPFPDPPLPYSSDTIKVDSIGSIVIGGDSLKVWYVSTSLSIEWGRRIIEKVGNDGLFVPKFALVEAYVWGLRCFENPDSAFHFVPYPCDTSYSTSGTVNIEANPVQVFPNPAAAEITLQIPDPVQGSWSLANFSGTTIQKGFWQGSSMRLNLQDAVPGLYFVVVRAEGKIWSGKFLKIE